MSASMWAMSSGRPWDAALDRLEQGLDRVEPLLAPRGADASMGGEVTSSPAATADRLAAAVAGLEALPSLDGDLPEHLGERARHLLARTDALVKRVMDELSHTDRALRDLTHRVPDRHRHPAYLDTRA